MKGKERHLLYFKRGKAGSGDFPNCVHKTKPVARQLRLWGGGGEQGKRRIKVCDALVLGGQRILISVFSDASTTPDPCLL